jgi:hypothetical protein
LILADHSGEETLLSSFRFTTYDHKHLLPNQKKTREIHQLVGKPFGFVERLKMNGNGSSRLEILGCSQKLEGLFRVSNDRRLASLELRPQGVILWFKDALEEFAWVIPHYHLSIYQNGEVFTIHASGQKASIQSAHGSFVKVSLFMRRIVAWKNKRWITASPAD